MTLLYIFLCIVLLYSVPTFANNKATCQFPSDVIAVIQNRYNLTLYGTKISIAYDLANASTKMLSQNIVELLLSTARVSFESVSSYEGRPAHEISFSFDTEPIVVHHKQNGEKRNCRAESSTNFGMSLDLNNDHEEAAVTQLTEYCIQNLLCDNFNSMVRKHRLQKRLYQKQELITKNFPHSSNHRQVKRSAVKRQNLIYNDSCSELLSHIYNPQNTINAMMDFGASVLISKLDKNKNGVFDIPEINTDFYVTWLFTSGKVTASNGKFWDLRKLKRVSDMVFTHDGLRFSVGSIYSLSDTKLTFSSYKVRFGYINVSGDISVDIGTLTVKAKASFDYNNNPCQATLDELNIEGLEQLDIRMTGLAPLNGAAADIIKRKIQSSALDSLREAVVQKLNELECEKFRPI